MKSIVGGSYVPSYQPPQQQRVDWGDAFDRGELETYFAEFTGDAGLFDKL